MVRIKKINGYRIFSSLIPYRRNGDNKKVNYYCVQKFVSSIPATEDIII